MEYELYIQNSSRWQRYRDADKTFVYKIYLYIEIYIAVSFVLFLVSIWMEDGILKSVILPNTYVVILLGAMHHGSLIFAKPWIILAAGSEAFLAWAFFEWIVSFIFVLGYSEVFCVYFFVLRYWQRGEEEVNYLSYQNILRAAKSRE